MTVSGGARDDGYDDGDDSDWDDTRRGDAGWRIAAPFFLAALVIWGIGIAVSVAQFDASSPVRQQPESFTRQITLATIAQVTFSIGGFVFAAGLLVLVLRQHERWRQNRYAPDTEKEDALPAQPLSSTGPQGTAPEQSYAQNNWDDPTSG